MKITNRKNLPLALERAARNDKYSKGDADYSVTELLLPARIRALRNRHSEDMSMDVVDSIWSLLGTAVHKIVEEAHDETVLAEERLYSLVHGCLVSGGVDYQKIIDFCYDKSAVRIIDFKVTSVYSLMYDKPEWEQQLNSYAYLVRNNKDVTVESLQICAILRDWRHADFEKDNSRYPDAPIQLVEIPIWDHQVAHDFLQERVALHESVGDDIPLCSPEERWTRDTKYAVYKAKTDKRAWRLFNLLCDAEKAAKEVNGVVQRRDGVPTRCTRNYCGVADFCSQWKKDERNVKF